uniref:Sugar phosphate transporter domain-containing protein n=2 Tax=Rhodosorus marinus TaxID=101924 RepID=A0A7S3EMW8_9RHOD|mmetsp:Transcript_4638/g.19865  ORF Transcript_4638/g.19865 Transcript_4638/m.19865 type:complete len:376 (+) Transcript_4638:263-1390(+)|eukprot:CAMPEP_0113963490 /NCGR_PEP_ID=MMETSP0011_2-20120614/6544_1 /TAXON_ID=101924 /ORGANISM="Rhodosorus marinus" /LENGTH=375 /DNA_ID=CAMNT_0000975549 /DNA_START=153 /DNA_END=1280 /DNA_ORIENTATION=+ /assembly_acc=CAM_ASM_000156
MAFVTVVAGSLRASAPVASTCRSVRSGFVGSGRQSVTSQNDAGSRRRTVTKMSASSAASQPPAEKEKTLAERAALMLYIGCWYGANIMFNIQNKKLLKMFPLYTTVTLFQFGMGALVAIVLWATGVHKMHKATKAELKSIYPLALSHLLGNILTNVSLRQMAVSFTHTIKAGEPFFSVALSKIFVPGTAFHPAVYASLLPIVAGVTLASANEVSFNWLGFGTAMSSNIAFQSRNVLSKKCMQDVKMDNLNLFGYISMLSFLTLLPFTLILEGAQYASVFGGAAGAGASGLGLLATLCICGFLHFLYNQFSYVVLQRVNPVTHSVGNTMKRVAVIVSSIVVFKNEVTTLNKIGTAIAIFGVGLYSQVKRLKPNVKK